ncbi:MAG TPA: hypothetical protein VGI70_22155 [Polyangiales bacterium]
MKSWVRSAASGAGAMARAIEPLRKRVAHFATRRLKLSDAQMTHAVARIPDVSAVTISTHHAGLRVDASFRDGGALLVHLVPESVAFAPRGAKEWSLRCEPERAVYDPRCADIVAALATEVARKLWGPFLRGRALPSGRGAIAHRDGTVLVVDLRSVPAVRSALTQPLMAAAIEAFGLRSIEAEDGGLVLVPGVPGFEL